MVRFVGTSNVLLAMQAGVEAIGTNAHELPMVEAALSDDDAGIAAAPYRVLEEWRRHYGGNLLIALPDAFGTTAFLRNAPHWLADWTRAADYREGARAAWVDNYYNKGN